MTWKPTLMVFAVLTLAQPACQTCPTGTHKCYIGEECHAAPCNAPVPAPATAGPTPGTVTSLGACADSGAHVAIYQSGFTTRVFSTVLNRLIADNTPPLCQAFDVAWNVCNSGMTRSGQISYMVSFKDDNASTNPAAFNFSQSYVDQPLNPCECVTNTFSFAAVGCNVTDFTPVKTQIITNLSPINGAFTVGG
jgi:hypothetical protein